MQTYEGMSPARLDEITSRFPWLRIAVVGDFFLDWYLDVDPQLEERSVETGRIAHQIVRTHHSPGAAGTVVRNLAALDAGTIHAIGFTGADGPGYDLRRDLSNLGCSIDDLHTEAQVHTPVYMKPRQIAVPGLAGEHDRYDIKNRRPTPADLQRKIIASLNAVASEVDAVILLDQVESPDCGVLTRAVRTAVSARAATDKSPIFWADSRRNIREFTHVITKPNPFEAVGVACPAPEASVGLDELIDAIGRLRRATEAPVCATRGEAGMLVLEDTPLAIRGIHIDGPVDPTGAGDSATAGAVLALAAGATLAEAALVGTLVSSITVTRLGQTGTASRAELAPRLALWREQNFT